MNSIIFGQFSVTLVDRHGARLAHLPLRAPALSSPRRAHGTTAPAPPTLWGREDELALVCVAARDQSAVEFTGTCGAGKTALLKNAAAAHADGTYLRVGGTALSDLLQDLMRYFYVYPGPDGTRLSAQQCAQQCAQALAGSRAGAAGVVALDDVSFSPEQLDYLRRALHRCTLVIGAPTPVLGALGTSTALPPLPEAAAVDLLRREAGRVIPDAELAAVRRLVAAVDGQPLYLRQAAALVRLDGRTFDDLARRAESDPGVLDELSISAIGPQAKRALAVLTLVGGALLPGAVLSQMADIAYVSETWESLSARGLAEQGEDRFGLPVCKAEPYRQILYRYIGLASAMRSLGDWLASGDPTGEEARGALDAALSLLGIAAQQRQWQAVVRLAAVVERVLFVQGHWQAWQHTLAQGITAAQAAGDTVSEAYYTHQQGVQHFLHDRTDHARRLLHRALDLRTRMGDLAGAAVTQANLALLEPAALPTPPSSRSPDARRRVITAVAAVIAVIAIGSALVQAFGDDQVVTDPPWPPVTSSSGATTGRPPTSSPPTSSSGVTPITDDAPDITPTTQGFGEVDINPGSKAQVLDFTVTNPNGQTIGLDSTDIPGDTGFSRAGGTCEDQLAAHAFCTVSVAFSPSRIGPASTELTITSGTSTATAKLSGTGFAYLTITFAGQDDQTVTVVDGEGEKVCEKSKEAAESDPCEMIPVLANGRELTASIDNTKYVFSGWSGDCTSDAQGDTPTPTPSSTSPPCRLPSDQEAKVTATFAPVTDPDGIDAGLSVPSPHATVPPASFSVGPTTAGT
ncbi:hypothetical protein ACI2L1_11890 [Streptomyces sp. NPDC019531]|uniref:hypothetical protein n=1 Tax=Streptomyces sp. NPDC019531 TaxID=3365062 RepID=UPI00384A9D5A